MKEIFLNSPTHGNKIALVDDEDYEYLNQWKWQVKKHRKTFYAHRTKQIPNSNRKKDHFKMHRVVMNVADPKIEVDHVDHNGLNCQRSNLRIATRKQNKQNASSHKDSASKYLGVLVEKRKNGISYCAQIGINGKSTHLGSFKSEEEAAKAYDRAAIKHYGEFANPNFK